MGVNEEALQPGMSQNHFWSIWTYLFSTNVGLNGRLVLRKLVDLASYVVYSILDLWTKFGLVNYSWFNFFGPNLADVVNFDSL